MTPEVRVVSETGGEKGQKLARFDLIPVGPLTALAEQFGAGAAKYADRNWEKGYPWSLNYAALLRHLTAFWGGEELDPETGTPHLAAVEWHAMVLLEFTRTHREFDDRPGSVSGLSALKQAAAGINIYTAPKGTYVMSNGVLSAAEPPEWRAVRA